MDETRTNRIMRQIKEICEIAGIRTEEYARVTKKRLDLVGLSRELNREKGALGERVFELFREDETADVFGDATVKAVLSRIRNLESTLGELETEIDDIRESASDRATDVKQKYQPPVTGHDGGFGDTSDAAEDGAGSGEGSAPVTDESEDAPMPDPPKKPALLEVTVEEDVEIAASSDANDPGDSSETGDAVDPAESDPLERAKETEEAEVQEKPTPRGEKKTKE